MRRARALVLLLLACVACHARKEQNVAPETAEQLYARGRAAVRAGDVVMARNLAQQGVARFGAQAHWRELFTILDADAHPRNERERILEKVPSTGDHEASVRRLLIAANAQKADVKYVAADAMAIRVFPALRPEIAAWRYLDLANAAKAEKKYPNALDYFDRSARYAHAAQMSFIEIPAKSNAGWLSIELGDLDRAKSYLTPVAEQNVQPGPQHTALVNLADIYVRRLEYDKALPYVQRARAVAEKLKNAKALANSYMQIGQIELELGHYKEAELWIAKAMKTRPADDCTGALDDLWNAARIYAATGRQTQALKILEDVLGSANDDLPLRWRVRGIKAEIFAKLGRLPEAEQEYKNALATGDATRKQVSGSNALFAFERNFLSFYDGYIDLLLQQGRKADALRIAESSRARALREKVQRDVDPVALARQKNATILCYWLGAKRSLLWVVTPRGIDVVDDLPADDVIDKAADAYRAELQSPRRRPETSELGTKLYTMLVAPARIAPGSRVIILPDAHLNGLSFDALLVPAKKPHYWIEDVTVSYSPSLHLLAATPAWQPPRQARALLFGEVPAQGRHFPKLARAGEEIDDVQRHFGARAKVLRDEMATPSAYKNANLKDYEFLHFATHAFAAMDAPLDSAVVLAPDKNGCNLSGEAIVGVPLAAELVTISGCNSAGRRNYVGEGLVGLAWAFLRAGAHRVVAAQWEVNDGAAPRIMNAMYAAMIDRGLEPAEALRQAKLDLLRSGGVFKRPMYWAPFAVYGAL